MRSAGAAFLERARREIALLCCKAMCCKAMCSKAMCSKASPEKSQPRLPAFYQPITMFDSTALRA